MRQQPLLRNIWFTDAGGESGRNFTEKKKGFSGSNQAKTQYFAQRKVTKRMYGKAGNVFVKDRPRKKWLYRNHFFILLPLLKNKLTVPRGRSIRKVMGGGGGDIHFAGIFFTQCLLSF